MIFFKVIWNRHNMKYQELSFAVTLVIIIVLVWDFHCKEKYVQEGMKYVHRIETSSLDCVSPGLFELHPGCCPHKICPADHFPFLLRSGAANMVGPKICFNNQIIMSGGLNNVGLGVNVAIVDGESGKILKSDFFKIHANGAVVELLGFLKTVEEGNIVLVASYEDPTAQLTGEVRELFAGMGSRMIQSVKYRDSWVFAGKRGLNKESPFEKLIVNDKKTNAYGDWPEMGELDGCFPRKV